MFVGNPIIAFPCVRSADRSYEIIHVVLRSLGAIDNRLIEHGERVAYLAGEILAAGPPLDVDARLLFVLSVLHDIGAYKTDEIDNLVVFESSDVERHAVYGYLFLKQLTRMTEEAEALLYHHTDYSRLPTPQRPYDLYAQLIHLADRVDILLTSNRSPASVAAAAGTRFHPQLVERFLAAEEAHGVTERIRTGAYRADVERQISNMRFSDEEILDFLNLLVCAMDFRSEYTVAHTANTTSISVQLGQLMGLPDDQLQKLYYGAVFHDLGKIAIPVNILEKPGRLTDAEMAIMRTHVVKSEEILRGVLDDEICNIAVRHHEKLNGTGYPYGLQATDLTQLERIVAVADIMSALGGKRSYKERYSKRDTLDILEGMRRRGELCPRVCRVMTDHYDDIMADAQLVENSMRALYSGIRSRFEQTIAQLS